MSAGVCGKRVGFEEIFGSSPKRSRRAVFGSPGFGSGADDHVFGLLEMFPAMDPEFVATVLRNHDNKVEDAKESLSALSADFAERDEPHCNDPSNAGHCDYIPPENTVACSKMLEQDLRDASGINQKFEPGSTADGSNWVDLFINEMRTATNLDDARKYTARILEAFERSITAKSRLATELELAALRERLQNLLNSNQILKKAIAIQHERNMEQEGRERELQHLKLVLSQYQEQLHKLELNNYTLRIHLQRAQESSSISGRFHPDVY